MNRSYSITESIFGDCYIAHASQPYGDDTISVSAEADTVTKAFELADQVLDKAIARMTADA